MLTNREFLKAWIKQEFAKGMIAEGIHDMRLDLVNQMDDAKAADSRQLLETYQKSPEFAQRCQRDNIEWVPV